MKIQELAPMVLVLMLKKLLTQVVQMENVMETENVMLVEEFHVILEIHSWENVMKIQELAQMALVLMLKKLLIQVVQMGNVMETENVILAEESHVILGIQSWENVMKIQELAPMVLVLMLKKLLTQAVQMENVMETENVT